MEKKKIKKIFIMLLLAFIIVFCARFAYEIYFSNNDVTLQVGGGGVSNYALESKSNIATYRYTQKDNIGQEVTVDQKYDKTADMSMHSDEFEETNQSIRRLVTDHNAVIQMENLSGLEGSQTLLMTIGVVPEAFDALVDSVKELARLRSFTVRKTDKTDEYRRLMAEIETLEKSRDAYLALQAQGGALQDQIMLQEKLLEIEGQLQTIGASAGIYASEHSFCTVNLSLVESKVHTYSMANMFHYARDSFFWTIAAFAIVLFLLTSLYGFSFVTVKVIAMMQGSSASRANEKKSDPDAEGEDSGFEK